VKKLSVLVVVLLVVIVAAPPVLAITWGEPDTEHTNVAGAE